jgi:hypothetical protein
MKSLLFFLVTTLLLQQAFSQKETFDIATYTPPKDWKKDANPGVVNFTSVNASTGKFCVITLYASKTSTGDAQKDFTNEWKELVVTPYKAEANPETQTQATSEGWKVVSAAAPAKMDGNDFYVLLSVVSGFGKSMTIRTSLNDASYTTEVDAFLGSVQLDNTKKAPVTNNAQHPADNNASIQTSGSTGKFGTMMYTIPSGWNVTKYPDGDILSPTDLPKGEFLEIWVQESMIFSGTMEDALQKSYNETVTKMQATLMNDVNGGNYNKQNSKISFRGWQYIRCSGGIHLGGGDYPPEYGLDLFVIKANGRFEKISITKSRKNCSYSTYYASDRLKYYNDIENFLFSLQFPDWKEPVVKKGIANGDDIAGVWQGISMSVGAPKTGTELGAELKVKQLIFFSNGQAFFGTNFPTEGLDDLNTWMRAENNRRDWGTYSFSNGKGILKLPYADVPLRMENAKLNITTSKTDHGFIKTKNVDGARFNGTYALSSKNFLGEETGKTPLISFTTDGRFTDNGALKILVHESVDCLNAAKEPGSGTYEIKNYSIIFNYSDGRKIKIAFIGSDYDKNNQSPSALTLSFNEDVLRRQ